MKYYVFEWVINNQIWCYMTYVGFVCYFFFFNLLQSSSSQWAFSLSLSLCPSRELNNLCLALQSGYWQVWLDDSLRLFSSFSICDGFLKTKIKFYMKKMCVFWHSGNTREFDCHLTETSDHLIKYSPLIMTTAWLKLGSGIWGH